MAGSQVPLAPIPGGTANVLCCETGIGRNPEKAARLLISARPVRIALGQMHTPETAPRYFLLMAGTGVDAIVVNSVNPAIKKRFGKLAYWLAGFMMFGRNLPQLSATLGPEKISCSFLLASRVRNYGGDLEIARSISLLQPYLELVTFSGRNSFRYLPYLLAVALGRPTLFPGVTVRHSERLRCATADDIRIPVQLDGELCGHLPAEFAVVPDSLTILLPESYCHAAAQFPQRVPERN